MNTKQIFVIGCVITALTLGQMPANAAPPAPVVLTEAGKALEAKYAARLKELQAEIVKALPAVDEGRKTAFQAAQEAVKKAREDVVEAQKPLDKIAGAAGLVGHRKNKWIAGANKGIAAAEAALKKATTDAEREAAKKDLAHWQANRADGEKALVEAQAALDAAKADEAKHVEARKAAQAALEAATARELEAAKALLVGVEPFLGSDKLDPQLVTCTVLAGATPRGLAEYAQQGKEQEAIVEKLLGDTGLMKAMLLAGGAEGGKYGAAAKIYADIRQANPRAAEGVLQRLALAVSLEHAVPLKQGNPAAATDSPAVVDPVKRYQHYEKAFLAGELDPAFKDMSVWELRSVVNGEEPDEILSWGREMLRNYRPDHVLNPDQGWRYSRAVTTDVKYGSQNVKDDLPTQHQFQNIIRNGGICGRRAFFGRFILRAFGIPTAARPQRGHAALARWTPDGWVVNLGAGWGYKDAKGVLGLSDADFLLETQARKFPDAYLESQRARWAGMAMGEPEYVSMKPAAPVGFWNSLALLKKKVAVAGAKPVQLAALGTELGEANESAEVRARALVKAEVTEADKKIVVDANGVITIPAAACGGAQILGSFLGGHQLFSGGGAITCEVEAPAAGAYTLTARVVTVQANPAMSLTVNDTKDAVEVELPYTVGRWQPTSPVRVTLVKGKNTLRFARPEGSRGLAVKDFTLKPVK